MSCLDCLKLFLPIYPTYEKPIHDLEELVIINNNNTTETTYLKDSSFTNPRKRIGSSRSEIKYLVKPEILEDEEELVFSRPEKEIKAEKKEIKAEKKEIKKIYEFENLSDTEILGNQKLKRRRKRFRILSNKLSENETSSSEDSWDDSLILNN